jgi:hypothetical protein
MDCSDETSLTQTWEDSFRSVLHSEVEEYLRNTAQNVFVMPAKENEKENENEQSMETPRIEPHHTSGTISSLSKNNITVIGQECSTCHNMTIVVYRRNGLLVCKKCR